MSKPDTYHLTTLSMKTSPQIKIRRLIAATTCLFAIVFLVACGSNSGGDASSSPPDYAKKLGGSPPELAAIHEQANELLGGGLDAFNQKIDGLKGFPIVVNIWASWCYPCRAEFPHFQDASANMGKKVAFLGVDSDDSEDAARTFLEAHPLSYPSFFDSDKDIANDLDATHSLPATAFFNSEGEKTYTKIGQYSSAAELEADIRNFAIEGNTD